MERTSARGSLNTSARGSSNTSSDESEVGGPPPLRTSSSSSKTSSPLGSQILLHLPGKSKTSQARAARTRKKKSNNLSASHTAAESSDSFASAPGWYIMSINRRTID